MSRARRRFRLRVWTRRAFAGLTVLVLAGAMRAAVERGAEARRLSDEIDRLQEREAVARARVARAMREVDSLSSRDRIARAVSRLGLRPAGDEEITFLRETEAYEREGGRSR